MNLDLSVKERAAETVHPLTAFKTQKSNENKIN